MATVQIVERGCRGCELCVEVCPVEVFERDAARNLAVVARAADCIGCLSCVYVCPSRCVEVGEVEMLRPFHRIERHSALLERFLHEPSVARALTAEDWAEAHADVAARLLALAGTVVETMGRGHKPVGRRAGAVAASHMPEMYEESGMDSLLAGLERELGVPFTHARKDESLELSFSPCSLCAVVEGAGQKVGEAVLCDMFHEYLAGLLSAYSGTSYKYELKQAGPTCKLALAKAR